MLKRLVLLTLCVLCSLGVAYGQRVASVDPTGPAQKSVRAAEKAMHDADSTGTVEESIAAWRDWINARDREPKNAPDIFDRSRIRGSDTIDKMNGWDRRLAGDKDSSRDRGRDRDAGRSEGSGSSSKDTRDWQDRVREAMDRRP